MLVKKYLNKIINEDVWRRDLIRELIREEDIFKNLLDEVFKEKNYYSALVHLEMLMNYLHNSTLETRLIKYMQKRMKRKNVGNNTKSKIVGYLANKYFLEYGRHEEKDKKEIENLYFQYIPYPRVRFVELVIRLQRKYNKKYFVDVGSGIGDKSFLALLFGDFESVTNVEYNKHTFQLSLYMFETLYKSLNRFGSGGLDLDAGKSTFNMNKGRFPLNVEFFNGDAFDYDFSKHDFIYSYVPIADRQVMKKLWKKIWKELKPGSIYLEVGSYLPKFLMDEMGVEVENHNLIGAVLKLEKNKARIIKGER